MLLIGRSIDGGSGPVSRNPGAATLTITGYAPSVDSSDVLLLNHFNGDDESTTLVDEFDPTVTWTIVNNAELDTAQKKFGTSSVMLPNGVNETITATGFPSQHLGSYTLEGWVRWSADFGTSFNINISFNNTGEGEVFSFTINGDGGGAQYSRVLEGVGSGTAGISIGSIAAETWYHWALVRNVDAGTYSIYWNGNRLNSESQSGNTFEHDTVVFENNTDNSVVVWFDDIRMTRTAVYTSDSYAVPTEEFTL